MADERFERRLTEESSALRQDMTKGFSDVRQELAKESAALRLEMHAGFAAIRQENALLRQELTKEISDAKMSMIRWSFMFWIGQVATTSGLMLLMLRAVGR
jgi:hypothetical protein